MSDDSIGDVPREVSSSQMNPGIRLTGRQADLLGFEHVLIKTDTLCTDLDKMFLVVITNNMMLSTGSGVGRPLTTFDREFCLACLFPSYGCYI